MQTAVLLSRPFYGFLVGPTLVLSAFSATQVSVDHLYRPLLVGSITGAISVVVVGAITRRWHAAALVVTFALLAVIGAFVLYAALGAIWALLAWRSLRAGRSIDVAPRMTRPLNTLVGLWFLIALATSGFSNLTVRSVPSSPAPTVSHSENVYLILLDGYPRHDTLMEYFGFDNGPFLEALAIRGFSVSLESRSEYAETILVVPSLLHMRPAEDLLDARTTDPTDRARQLWRSLNEAPVPQAYENAGFTTYSIVSPAPALDWRRADVVIESPWLSIFERHLLERGVLRLVLPLDAMHRAAILDAFTYLESTAGTSPRFVLAHILSPHDPYVFSADGSPAEPCGTPCLNHTGPPNPMLGDRLIGQLTFINSRLLQAVDRIIAIDPEGVIVIFSDHGLRRDPDDREEWHRILFAARNRTLPQDITPLNLFPVLLD